MRWVCQTTATKMIETENDTWWWRINGFAQHGNFKTQLYNQLSFLISLNISSPFKYLEKPLTVIPTLGLQPKG